MKFTREQRRSFIGLACRIAWADGVVSDEEREFVEALVARFAADELSDEELAEWLDSGVPEHELVELPSAINDLFVYEAMRLMEIDGDIDDRELEQLDHIMHRLFAKHSKGAELGRIALASRVVAVPTS